MSCISENKKGEKEVISIGVIPAQENIFAVWFDKKNYWIEKVIAFQYETSSNDNYVQKNGSATESYLVPICLNIDGGTIQSSCSEQIIKLGTHEECLSFAKTHAEENGIKIPKVILKDKN